MDLSHVLPEPIWCWPQTWDHSGRAGPPIKTEPVDTEPTCPNVNRLYQVLIYTEVGQANMKKQFEVRAGFLKVIGAVGCTHRKKGTVTRGNYVKINNFRLFIVQISWDAPIRLTSSWRGGLDQRTVHSFTPMWSATGSKLARCGMGGFLGNKSFNRPKMNPPDRRWAGAPPSMSLGSASLLLSGQSWWISVLLLHYSHNNKTLIVYLFKGFMSLITCLQLHLLTIVCEPWEWGVTVKDGNWSNFVQNIPFIINAKG